MGDFTAEIRIGSIAGGDTHPVSALVDTGATESAFPADLLEWLHIPATERPMDYVLADGTVLRCPRGYARIAITVRSGETFSSICPVAFWPDESGQCIGATTFADPDAGGRSRPRRTGARFSPQTGLGRGYSAAAMTVLHIKRM